METIISNAIYFDKTPDEWTANHNYKAQGGSKLESTDIDFIRILQRSIPHRLEKAPFKDQPLTTDEIISLKNILEQDISELLIGRTPIKLGRPVINFLEQDIKLDIFPTGVNDRDMYISILHDTYKICEECLKDDKPVYLSIVKEE